MLDAFNYYKSIMSMFAGDGYLVMAGIICIVIMAFIEMKNRDISWLMLLLTIGLMNPFSIMFMKRYLFDNDSRVAKVLMIVPIFIAIAYVVTKYCKKWYEQVIVILLICTFGTCILSDANFQKPANWYKLDPVVVGICDFIERTEIDHTEQVVCLVDESLVSYIRQYDPRLVLLLSRWQLGLDDDNPDSLVYQMKSQVVDAQKLSELAKAYDVEYIVLPQSREYTEAMDQYGYLFWGELAGYYIYHNMSIHTKHIN